MTAHRLSITRLILTGGFASAIAIAPALAVSLSGVDSFVAQPGCPPSQTGGINTSQCLPRSMPAAGAPSEMELSQPVARRIIGAPSERVLTDCHGRTENNNCLSAGFYGPR
jgi:hypothetical protein